MFKAEKIEIIDNEVNRKLLSLFHNKEEIEEIFHGRTSIRKANRN